MTLTELPLSEAPSLKLLSHASVKITAPSVVILTDPWFFGRVFNNGWGLSPEPDIVELKSDLTDVTHIWISHEHPDHLHFPSLRFLYDEVGLEDVQILFQETNSDKVFDALKRIGYSNFQTLPHLKVCKISEYVDVISYAHRHLDSCLAVRVQGKNWILNINDTELNTNDCNVIREKVGIFPILLNQYSIAGFEGIYNTRKMEDEKLAVISKMLFHHQSLSDCITIPIASLMYFCKPDNKDFNIYRNTVFDAKKAFADSAAYLLLLKPQGAPLTCNSYSFTPINTDEIDKESTAFFQEYYKKVEELKIDANDELVSFDEIKLVVEKRIRSWQCKTFSFVIKKMGIVYFWVEDLEMGISVNFYEASVQQKPISPEMVDIVICSQPLHFAFATSFGIQTLGVSGRYRFADHIQEIPLKWKLVRIISSLANADLFLGWRMLFDIKVAKWIWSRRKGLLSQVWQQFRRFRN